MLTIKLTQKFKKDLDRTYRRGYDLSLLSNAIQLIAKGQTLRTVPVGLRDPLSSLNFNWYYIKVKPIFTSVIKL